MKNLFNNLCYWCESVYEEHGKSIMTVLVCITTASLVFGIIEHKHASGLQNLIDIHIEKTDTEIRMAEIQRNREMWEWEYADVELEYAKKNWELIEMRRDSVKYNNMQIDSLEAIVRKLMIKRMDYDRIR